MHIQFASTSHPPTSSSSSWTPHPAWQGDINWKSPEGSHTGLYILFQHSQPLLQSLMLDSSDASNLSHNIQLCHVLECNSKKSGPEEVQITVSAPQYTVLCTARKLHEAKAHACSQPSCGGSCSVKQSVFSVMEGVCYWVVMWGHHTASGFRRCDLKVLEDSALGQAKHAHFLVHTQVISLAEQSALV